MYNLSSILGMDVMDLIKQYQEVIKSDILDIMEYLPKDDIELFLLEKGIDFEFMEFKSEKIHRPMIVTIMGHVDHGKTTLLDTFRKSNLVDADFFNIKK
jgi:GTPase